MSGSDGGDGGYGAGNLAVKGNQSFKIKKPTIKPPTKSCRSGNMMKASFLDGEIFDLKEGTKWDD